MTMLSEDDRNLRDLSDEELALAWDLWFDLAQTTNDADPPYSHGVFQLAAIPGSVQRGERWTATSLENVRTGEQQ
jgi:hypothetical protein